MRKGFVMLPNLILKLFMAQELSSSDKACLAVIIRQTLGYNRDSWQISVREFQEQTGFSRRNIFYSLEKLQLMQYVALVNRGNSRLSFSEWKLNDKLVQPVARAMPRLVQKTAPDKPPELVQRIAQTSAMPTPRLVPVNTSLNTAAAVAIKNILSSKSNAELRGTDLYVGGKKINSPVSYWKAIQDNHPAPFSTPVEKPAKEMTDQELRDYFSSKRIGIDEDIPQDYVYQALERKIL